MSSEYPIEEWEKDVNEYREYRRKRTEKEREKKIDKYIHIKSRLHNGLIVMMRNCH